MNNALTCTPNKLEHQVANFFSFKISASPNKPFLYNKAFTPVEGA